MPDVTVSEKTAYYLTDSLRTCRNPFETMQMATVHPSKTLSLPGVSLLFIHQKHRTLGQQVFGEGPYTLYVGDDVFAQKDIGGSYSVYIS